MTMYTGAAMATETIKSTITHMIIMTTNTTQRIPIIITLTILLSVTISDPLRTSFRSLREVSMKRSLLWQYRNLNLRLSRTKSSSLIKMTAGRKTMLLRSAVTSILMQNLFGF